MGMTLWEYYLNTAAKTASSAFSGIDSLSDWESRRLEIRTDFIHSMGLCRFFSTERQDPRPIWGDVVYGKGYCARPVSYSLLENCRGSGMFFLPNTDQPSEGFPAVIYLCGHLSKGAYGYQEHGIMWARRGYACLMIDSIEQFENFGSHKGPSAGKLEWISMGYTSAGGELLNSIRALDLLVGVPEVDSERIGATGISGGGAHSFYLTVADDRIKALASVCGVPDTASTLRDRHFIHHCDCMFYNNVHFRDISEFAALIAPLPTLYCFASEDSLFSTDGYRSFFERTSKIYSLYSQPERCRLLEYPGPHEYTAETIAAINDWFDEHIAKTPRPAGELAGIEIPVEKFSFDQSLAPSRAKLRLLPEFTVSEGTVELPETPEHWENIRTNALKRLNDNVLATIEKKPATSEFRMVGEWFGNTDGLRYHKYSGIVDGVEIWLNLWIPPDFTKLVLAVAEQNSNVELSRWSTWDFASGVAFAYLEPRGSGFTGCQKSQNIYFERCGLLTGKPRSLLTLEDISATRRFIETLGLFKNVDFFLYGRADAAVSVLYHSLFDNSIAGIVLEKLPKSHRIGGYIPHVLEVMDIQHAVGLMAPRPVGLVNSSLGRCHWGALAYERIGIPERLLEGVSLEKVLSETIGLC